MSLIRFQCISQYFYFIFIPHDSTIHMECTGLIGSCPNMNKFVDVSCDKRLCIKIFPLYRGNIYIVIVMREDIARILWHRKHLILFKCPLKKKIILRWKGMRAITLNIEQIHIKFRLSHLCKATHLHTMK